MCIARAKVSPQPGTYYKHHCSSCLVSNSWFCRTKSSMLEDYWAGLLYVKHWPGCSTSRMSSGCCRIIFTVGIIRPMQFYGARRSPADPAALHIESHLEHIAYAAASEASMDAVFAAAQGVDAWSSETGVSAYILNAGFARHILVCCAAHLSIPVACSRLSHTLLHRVHQCSAFGSVTAACYQAIHTTLW